MSPRRLVSESATSRRYEVTNAQGKVIGYDDEPILSPEDTNQAATTQAARAYLTAPTPNAAETAKQVRRLTRLVLGIHDGPD